MYYWFIYLLFYLWAWQSEYSLPDREHKYNPRVKVTIHIAYADSATLEHGDPYYGGLVILLYNWASVFALVSEIQPSH